MGHPIYDVALGNRKATITNNKWPGPVYLHWKSVGLSFSAIRHPINLWTWLQLKWEKHFDYLPVSYRFFFSTLWDLVGELKPSDEMNIYAYAPPTKDKRYRDTHTLRKALKSN